MRLKLSKAFKSFSVTLRIVETPVLEANTSSRKGHMIGATDLNPLDIGKDVKLIATILGKLTEKVVYDARLIAIG